MGKKLIDRIQALVDLSNKETERIAVLRDRRRSLISQLKKVSGKNTPEQAIEVADQLRDRAVKMEKNLDQKLKAIEEKVYEEEE